MFAVILISLIGAVVCPTIDYEPENLPVPRTILDYTKSVFSSCEVRLNECVTDLETQEVRIERLEGLLDDSDAQLVKLREEYYMLELRFNISETNADHLRKAWQEVSDSLSTTRIFLYSLIGFQIMIVLAVIMPQLIKVMRVGRQYLSRFIGYVLLLPTRLVSHMRYRSGDVEEIPLMDLPSGYQEAVLPHSRLMSVTNYPKFVVSLCRVNENFESQVSVVGMGFWVGDYLVTAAHVLESVTNVVHISNPNAPENYVRVEKGKFVRLGSQDVAMIPVGGLVERLKISKAKTPGVALSGKQMVSVCSRGHMTNGILKPDSFGLVRYEGTTLPGFSGTPYFVANHVFGIHLSSTAEAGFGLDIDLVCALFKKYVRNESSEDFILEEMARYGKAGKKFAARRHGIDEIVVRFNGKHYLYDAEEIAGVLDYLEEERSYVKGTPEVIEVQDEPKPSIPVDIMQQLQDLISKNDVRPLLEAMEQRLKKIEDAQEYGRMNAEYARIRPQSLGKEPTVYCYQEPIVPSTSGRIPTPAPRNEVLPVISKSSKKPRRRNQVQQLKSELALLRTQLATSTAGK